MLYPDQYEWYQKLENTIDTQVHIFCLNNNEHWGWYLNDFISQTISACWKIPIWTIFFLGWLFIKSAKVFLLMMIICAAQSGGNK